MEVEWGYQFINYLKTLVCFTRNKHLEKSIRGEPKTFVRRKTGMARTLEVLYQSEIFKMYVNPNLF